jgi:hypothetical protein
LVFSVAANRIKVPMALVTYLSQSRFSAQPQVGVPIRQEWHSLLRWLIWPSFADSKKAHGAWCPTALEGGAVKGGKGSVALLVADVDECAGGAIGHSAAVLAHHAGASDLGRALRRSLLIEIRQQLEQARADTNVSYRERAALMGVALSTLKMAARLRGGFEVTQAQILRSSHWRRLRDLLGGVLERHPQAAQEWLEALRQGDQAERREWSARLAPSCGA